MSHAYTKEARDGWRRIHANGEETHVRLLDCGDRCVVVAFDVDPREFAAVASECIAYSPTRDAAKERAVAWMEQNPRGVAGDGGGGGFASKMVSGLKKLDQSASPAEADVETEETQ